MKFKHLTFIGMTVCLLASCGGDSTGTDASDTSNKAEPHIGKATYDAFCKVCHAQGLNGAPILGNTAMWGPRTAKGPEALVANAANGYGLMPANLGRDPELDNQAIANAVDYMLSEL